MTYTGLFQHYQPLKGKGKAWIRTISAEDRAVFVSIGLEEGGHGQKGGRAVYTKRGSDHMKQIGRIGAIAANSKKLWNRLMQEELTRDLGVTFDF